MKVKELIKELKTIPEDYEVVLSSDEEGNNYSTFDRYVEYSEQKRVVLFPSHNWIDV